MALFDFFKSLTICYATIQTANKIIPYANASIFKGIKGCFKPNPFVFFLLQRSAFYTFTIFKFLLFFVNFKLPRNDVHVLNI